STPYRCAEISTRTSPSSSPPGALLEIIPAQPVEQRTVIAPEERRDQREYLIHRSIEAHRRLRMLRGGNVLVRDPVGRHQRHVLGECGNFALRRLHRACRNHPAAQLYHGAHAAAHDACEARRELAIARYDFVEIAKEETVFKD